MHCRDFRLLTAPVTLAAPMTGAIRPVRLPAPGLREILRKRSRSAFPPAGTATRMPARRPEF
jgi:hypothetical protein